MFSLDEIKYGIKRLSSGKAKDVEGYQEEFIKIGSFILATYIETIFNIYLKEGFPKKWNLSSIIHIYKFREKSNLSNYKTIIIINLFVKLFGSIIENKISN